MDDIMLSHLSEMKKLFLAEEASVKIIYVISIFLFFSFLAVTFVKKLKIPSVVAYTLLGISMNDQLIHLIPFLTAPQKEWYSFALTNLDIIPDIALSFIAFTIGSELSLRVIRRMGKSVFFIVILEAFSAFILVTLALLAIGKDLYFALIFGAIASATGPAATVMVMKEYNSKGPVTSMILSVVGMDDAVALFIFSIVSPIAFILYSGQGHLSFTSSFMIPVLEIIASILIGFVIGYISLKALKEIDDKTKKVLLVVVTIISGVAFSHLFHLSALITNMTIGFTFRNLALKNLGIADYLDTFTIPLYALFFILAGTKMNFTGILEPTFLLLAFVYILSRIGGKIGGTITGAKLANAPKNVQKYVGFGLLPQGGVALALCYSISNQFSDNPALGILAFKVVLFTGIFTDVFGPIATKFAIFQSGEARETTS